MEKGLCDAALFSPSGVSLLSKQALACACQRHTALIDTQQQCCKVLSLLFTLLSIFWTVTLGTQTRALIILIAMIDVTAGHLWLQLRRYHQRCSHCCCTGCQKSAVVLLVACKIVVLCCDMRSMRHCPCHLMQTMTTPCCYRQAGNPPGGSVQEERAHNARAVPSLYAAAQ